MSESVFKTIWRYNFPVSDDVTLPNVPEGAEVLPHVERFGDGAVSIWAVVDPAATPGPRVFHVRGTGHPLGEVGAYVGTAADGPFIWHVFEAVAR